MQTKLHSFLEVLFDMAIGFCLALIVNSYLLSYLGLAASTQDNFYIVLCMTVLSIVRRYITRRIANWWHVRQRMNKEVQDIFLSDWRETYPEYFEQSDLTQKEWEKLYLGKFEPYPEKTTLDKRSKREWETIAKPTIKGKDNS